MYLDGRPVQQAIRQAILEGAERANTAAGEEVAPFPLRQKRQPDNWCTDLAHILGGT
jgi:hypothetical protein